MVKTEYLYNNEAIGAVAIASVLKTVAKLSFSKTVLILPFLFHRDTSLFLKRSNAVIRSIEEIIIKRTESFGNFNSRYISLLPITINSIMLLKQMGVIKMHDNNLIFINTLQIDPESKELGNRAADISKAAAKLAALLACEDDSSLYLKLRIQL